MILLALFLSFWPVDTVKMEQSREILTYKNLYDSIPNVINNNCFKQIDNNCQNPINDSVFVLLNKFSEPKNMIRIENDSCLWNLICKLGLPCDTKYFKKSLSMIGTIPIYENIKGFIIFLKLNHEDTKDVTESIFYSRIFMVSTEGDKIRSIVTLAQYNKSWDELSIYSSKRYDDGVFQFKLDKISIDVIDPFDVPKIQMCNFKINQSGYLEVL